MGTRSCRATPSLPLSLSLSLSVSLSLPPLPLSLSLLLRLTNPGACGSPDSHLSSELIGSWNPDVARVRLSISAGRGGTEGQFNYTEHREARGGGGDVTGLQRAAAARHLATAVLSMHDTHARV